MTSDLESLNVWDKEYVVKTYQEHLSLYIPETLIFMKYKEHLFNSNILDIGCGAGRTTYVLSRVTQHYVGIDYSQRMVDSCTQRFPKAQIFHGDARNMGQFTDNTFDFILFSFNGLDCLDHQGRLLALGEIQRVAKKGALFVFSAHNRNFIHAQMHPRLYLCKNPLTFIKNLYIYYRTLLDYRSTKRNEIECKEYRLIASEEHDFSHLYYYIDKAEQVAQLRKAGFETMEMYDWHGNTLDETSNDTSSCWIYYVAKKI